MSVSGIGNPQPPLEAEMFDPEECRSLLPDLKAGLQGLTRFVAMIEKRAEEAPGSVCTECGSRFYPLRSDARFCGGTCRQRAHRRGSQTP